jgi:hypothetical protein
MAARGTRLSDRADRIARHFISRYEAEWSNGGAEAVSRLYASDAVLVGLVTAIGRSQICALLRGIIGQGWTSIRIKIVNVRQVRDLDRQRMARDAAYGEMSFGSFGGSGGVIGRKVWRQSCAGARNHCDVSVIAATPTQRPAAAPAGGPIATTCAMTPPDAILYRAGGVDNKAEREARSILRGLVLGVWRNLISGEFIVDRGVQA